MLLPMPDYLSSKFLFIKKSGELIVVSTPSLFQHVPEDRCFGKEGNPSPLLFVVPSYHLKLYLLLISTYFMLGFYEETVWFQWK